MACVKETDSNKGSVTNGKNRGNTGKGPNPALKPLPRLGFDSFWFKHRPACGLLQLIFPKTPDKEGVYQMVKNDPSRWIRFKMLVKIIRCLQNEDVLPRFAADQPLRLNQEALGYTRVALMTVLDALMTGNPTGIKWELMETMRLRPVFMPQYDFAGHEGFRGYEQLTLDGLVADHYNKKE